MTTLVDYTDRFLNTADALDYTIHEIDDLTDRKVEAVEVDGDALARVVRARRGAARATGQDIGHGRYNADETGVRYCYCPRGEDHTDGDRQHLVAGGRLRGTAYPTLAAVPTL